VEEEIRESLRTTERLLDLSDGVFAFALTLLALNLQLPDGLTPPQFRAELVQLLRKSASYAISVVMIGIYWMAHQRMFRFIKCYDHKLLWLNLLFLMSITFIPPLTAALHAYGAIRICFIVYVGSLATSTALLSSCWRHATSRPNLVTRDLDAAIIRYYNLRSLSYIAVFAATVLIAFISPMVAQYALLFLMAILPLVDRLRRPTRA
jgi:uncharacterized membrane protein